MTIISDNEEAVKYLEETIKNIELGCPGRNITSFMAFEGITQENKNMPETD